VGAGVFESIRCVIEGVERTDDSGLLQTRIAEALRKDGWVVDREVEVNDRGDGRRGFVDLGACKNGIDVGIEIDRENARAKSIRKLSQRPWLKVIVLRGHADAQIPGIDLVIPLGISSTEFVPGLDGGSWDRWLEYRRQIKRPLKQASIPAAQRKLAAFGDDQAAVIEQSIANGWQGLFPLGRAERLRGKPRGFCA
jgi:hypothetical protein